MAKDKFAQPQGPDDLLVDQDPQQAVASQGFAQLLSSGNGTTQNAPMEGVEPESDPFTDLAGGYIGSKLGSGAAEILGNEIGAVGKSIKKAAPKSLAAATAEQKALPMDEASRLARAKEAGFDTSKTYYHGTAADIKRFKDKGSPHGAMLGKGTYLTEDPEYAAKYAAQNPQSSFEDPAGGNVLPVHVSVKNPFDLSAPASKKLISALKEEAKYNPDLQYTLKSLSDGSRKKDNGDVLAAMTGGRVPFNRQTQILQDAGYDAVKDDHVLNVFEPHQIRSKFAEFDPKQAKSGKLSFASGGMASPLGPLPLQPEFNQQPSIRSAGSDNYLDSPDVDALLNSSSALDSPEFDKLIEPEIKHEKYGSTGQMLKAGLEGAAQGLAGPLAPLAEIKLGLATDEDIRGRAEENPITRGVGEAAGLIAPALLTGAGSLASRAGLTGAAEAASIASKFSQAGVLDEIGARVGLKAGDSLLSKIGVGAAKGAIDNALLSGSDEASKVILNDPNLSAGNVATSIGLSGILGAGVGGTIGAVSPLWKSVFGEKAGQLAEDFKAAIREHTGIARTAPEALHSDISDLYGEAKKIGNVARDADFVAAESKAPIDIAVESKEAAKLAKAHSEFEPALKKFEKAFTVEAEDGSRIVDPESIVSYYNKLKGVESPKQKILKDFVKASEDYKASVNEVYESLGHDAPLQPTPLNAISASLGEKTMGRKIADAFVEKALKDGGGAAIGGSLGAAVGHATGLPGAAHLGALVGAGTIGKFFDSVLPGIAKFLVMNKTSSAGFKAAVDYAGAIAKGETLLNKGASSIFKVTSSAASEKAAQSMLPTEKDRAKLDKMLRQIQTNPSVLLDKTNNLNHYMPDHALSLNSLSASASSFLNSLRPDQDKKAPLDSKPVPSATAKAKYDNALNIAEQPMIIFDKIQKGTLTSADIQTLGTLYPQLFNSMKAKVNDAMTVALSKGQAIPYKTRIGISMFMAQPLDSTIIPSSIQAAQLPSSSRPQPDQQSSPKGSPSSPALQKLPGTYKTSSQAREAARTK